MAATAEARQIDARGIDRQGSERAIDNRACGAIGLYRKGTDRGLLIEKFIASFDVKR